MKCIRVLDKIVMLVPNIKAIEYHTSPEFTIGAIIFIYFDELPTVVDGVSREDWLEFQDKLIQRKWWQRLFHLK